MPASWLDSLLGLPALPQATPGPAKKEGRVRRAQKALPPAQRKKWTYKGRCRACGQEVFWSDSPTGMALIEIRDRQVLRHRCHGVLPDEFEDLTK